MPQLYDLHTAMEAIRGVCHERTRVIVCTFSRVWQPAIRLTELLGWKARVPDESWLPPGEVKSLMSQCDFDIVRQENGILLPVGIPLLGNWVNRWIAPLPRINQLDLCTVTVARMLPRTNRLAVPKCVSVIVPARNEAGNIRPLLERIPKMGEKTEVIFVEGNSTDDTWEMIQKVVAAYQADASPGGARHSVSCCKQTGRGKGDAVRLGFQKATGEILMILDADISVPPEELPRFVELLSRQQCEFANGSRLVYPMEKQAMQFLNMIANKCFGWMFTYLLGQRLRDTLCGTKVLRKSDYEKIVANRAYFGDFDPFGDFDLLFGAAAESENQRCAGALQAANLRLNEYFAIPPWLAACYECAGSPRERSSLYNVAPRRRFVTRQVLAFAPHAKREHNDPRRTKYDRRDRKAHIP